MLTHFGNPLLKRRIDALERVRPLLQRAAKCLKSFIRLTELPHSAGLHRPLRFGIETLISLVTFRTVLTVNHAAIPASGGLRVIGIGALLLGLTSCGSQVGPKLPPKLPCIEVAGQVRVDGVPAEGVQVVLHPVDEDHGLYQFPMGVTDAEGEFKLGTYVSEDGAPAGNYVAVFIWPIPIDEQVDDDDRLKRLYSDPRKSKFKVTIDDTRFMLDPFDLKLKGLQGIRLSNSELKKLKFQQKRQKVIESN